MAGRPDRDDERARNRSGKRLILALCERGDRVLANCKDFNR